VCNNATVTGINVFIMLTISPKILAIVTPYTYVDQIIAKNNQNVLSQFAHLFKIFDQKFGQGTMV
jgi:hypothetical protein